ncbi:MAG: DUF4159 domain-containing protein [Vicinamibacterales bacterium]|nr:DUF4159 domain-containing protein [Vicinamibacterales bacterium]
MLFKKSVALLAFVLLIAAGSYAQRRGGGGYSGIRRPEPNSFTGSFTFCRIAFRTAYGGYGGGWGVDYPRADQNLPIRLSELTKAAVNFDESGTPQYLVIQATEPELFKCPFVAVTNHGRAYFGPEEVAALRAYLQKGGFLWADDAWGTAAWDHWEAEIRKVLPAADYPLVDLPLNHSIFHTLFDVKRIPQIPNIGFYQGSGGQTSERGYDSEHARAVAILDSQGRVLVLTTHNTDFGDAYERESDDPSYFYKFSVEGYAVGINVLLYAMTH